MWTSILRRYMNSIQLAWSYVKSFFSSSDDECHVLDYCDKEFLIWAFGESYLTLTPIGKMDAWNAKHGDILMLQSSWEITSKLEKLATLYAASATPKPNPPIDDRLSLDDVIGG